MVILATRKIDLFHSYIKRLYMSIFTANMLWFAGFFISDKCFKCLKCSSVTFSRNNSLWILLTVFMSITFVDGSFSSHSIKLIISTSDKTCFVYSSTVSVSTLSSRFFKIFYDKLLCVLINTLCSGFWSFQQFYTLWYLHTLLVHALAILTSWVTQY